MHQTKPWDRRDFLTHGAAFAAALSIAPAAPQKGGDPGEPNPHTRPAPNRRHIVIYRDPFAYCSHASIVRLANGEWITAFNECQRRTPYTHPPGDPHFHNLISRTDDEGKTWSPPQATPNWDWYGVECPGLAQLKDGTVVLNQWQFLWYPLNQGRKLASQGREIWLRTSTEQGWAPTLSDTDWSRSLYPWCRANGGCYVQLSSDGGRTWDRSVKIPTEPYMGGYTPRGVAQLQDGTVLMVTADHPLNHTVYAVRSRDGGLNWSKPVALGKVDEGHMSEPTAVELPSGKIVAMIRSSTHHLHQSESSDGGLTWTPIHRTPIFGYPGHLLLLSDGRMLTTYGHRRSPFGIRACLSRDGGQSWDYDKEVVIRGDFPNRNLGYPHDQPISPSGLPSSCCCWPSYRPSQPVQVSPKTSSTVADIGSRREFFVDHLLLERLIGTRLQLHHPEPAETVLKLDRPWEGDTGHGLSVIQDGDTYHMYYQGRTRRPVPARRTPTLYARSQDGIHWEKPNLGLVPIKGSLENNQIGTTDGNPLYAQGEPGVEIFIDRRPGVPKGQRFKASLWTRASRRWSGFMPGSRKTVPASVRCRKHRF